jgi:hypothetical protein
MATKDFYNGEPTTTQVKDDGVDGSPPAFVDGVVGDEETYQYDESRKIGITGAVFLILNKMIGTGIFSTPSGIFAATGSVGVSLFLWIIGKLP